MKQSTASRATVLTRARGWPRKTTKGFLTDERRERIKDIARGITQDARPAAAHDTRNGPYVYLAYYPSFVGTGQPATDGSTGGMSLSGYR